MKKIYSVLLFCFLAVQQLVAQLPDGTVAPDFTLQDINGNSFNLYNDGMNQGKYVVIDFFATWCGPCWNDFQAGIMENVYNWYGDEGTCDSDVIVIGIEADITTYASDLEGIGNNTQGDWVTGTPYRLFDPMVNTVMDLYDVSYYPTYYVICPDGLVYAQNFYDATQMSIAALSCSQENDVDAGIVEDTDCNAMTYTPQISFTNNNIPSLTSIQVRYHYDNDAEQFYNWSGSVPMGAEGTLVLPTQTFDAGLHDFTYTLENPNGATDHNKTNNCGSPPFLITPGGDFVELNEDFNGGALPDDWVFVNFIDDLEWRYSDANGGCLQMPGYEYFSTQDYPIYGWTPYVDLTYATEAYLQFDYAYANFPGFNDGFTLEVRSSCLDSIVFDKYGEDLATVPPTDASYVPETGDWETFCFDLTPFLGTKIFFWYTGTYNFGNNYYIDNFKVSTNNCFVGIDEISTGTPIRIYPNPAKDVLYIEMTGRVAQANSMNIVDSRGQVVKSMNPKQMNSGIQSVDISDLANGLYLIEWLFSDHTETSKVIVEK